MEIQVRKMRHTQVPPIGMQASGNAVVNICHQPILIPMHMLACMQCIHCVSAAFWAVGRCALNVQACFDVSSLLHSVCYAQPLLPHLDIRRVRRRRMKRKTAAANTQASMPHAGPIPPMVTLEKCWPPAPANTRKSDMQSPSYIKQVPLLLLCGKTDT
jgi:hypothetical protein